LDKFCFWHIVPFFFNPGGVNSSAGFIFCIVGWMGIFSIWLNSGKIK
jgi:hypothetical protein